MDEDIREAVARAIRSTDVQQRYTTYGEKADAAILAATPLIRKQVIEELAREAGAMPQDDTGVSWEDNPFSYETLMGNIQFMNDDIADWLCSHLEDDQ